MKIKKRKKNERKAMMRILIQQVETGRFVEWPTWKDIPKGYEFTGPHSPLTLPTTI